MSEIEKIPFDEKILAISKNDQPVNNNQSLNRPSIQIESFHKEEELKKIPLNISSNELDIKRNEYPPIDKNNNDIEKTSFSNFRTLDDELQRIKTDKNISLSKEKNWIDPNFNLYTNDTRNTDNHLNLNNNHALKITDAHFPEIFFRDKNRENLNPVLNEIDYQNTREKKKFKKSNSNRLQMSTLSMQKLDNKKSSKATIEKESLLLKRPLEMSSADSSSPKKKTRLSNSDIEEDNHSLEESFSEDYQDNDKDDQESTSEQMEHVSSKRFDNFNNGRVLKKICQRGPNSGRYYLCRYNNMTHKYDFLKWLDGGQNITLLDHVNELKEMIQNLNHKIDSQNKPYVISEKAKIARRKTNKSNTKLTKEDNHQNTERKSKKINRIKESKKKNKK